MTLRRTNLQNHPTGLPAEDERLIRQQQTPAAGLHGASGIIPAAAGFVGEVTLLNDSSLTINPFRANIAGTQSAAQGDYGVTNDAALTLTIGARQAGLSRIDLLVTRVRDTAYTPNEGTNDVVTSVVPGTPAASNPVAPAVPPNAYVHGTLTIPATGAGSVTYTPAAASTSVAVGGIRPVPSTDVTVGRYDGQYRDLPGIGAQRWSVTLGAWQSLGGLYVPPAALAANAGWYNFYPTKDAVTPWEKYAIRCTGREVAVDGLIGSASALAAGTTYLITPVGGIPQALRPPAASMQEIKSVTATLGVNRSDVRPDGSISIVPSVAIAADTALEVHLRWNLDNSLP